MEHVTNSPEETEALHRAAGHGPQIQAGHAATRAEPAAVPLEPGAVVEATVLLPRAVVGRPVVPTGTHGVSGSGG